MGGIACMCVDEREKYGTFDNAKSKELRNLF